MQTIPIAGFQSEARVPIEVLQRQAATVAGSIIPATIFSSALNYVLILNPQRQIIYASPNFLEVAKSEMNAVIGKRPGEVFCCERAGDMNMECGASLQCGECGLAKAVLASLAGHPSLQESRLTRVIECSPEAMDLTVHATPFQHEGQIFSLVTIADVSHRNRRRALEQIFFHDVMNTAGSLVGLAGMLKSDAPAHMAKDLDLMETVLRDLLEEIAAQKDLAAAEANELGISPLFVKANDFMEQLARKYQAHELAKARRIRVERADEKAVLYTDRVLLQRVVGNLLKNALEASSEGDCVEIGVERVREKSQFRFWVKNPSIMNRDVQLNVFSRSFSTKGNGRGLGTYSVKLLTEKYLQGKVDFRSEPGQGTQFVLYLPEALTERPGPDGINSPESHTH